MAILGPSGMQSIVAISRDTHQHLIPGAGKTTPLRFSQAKLKLDTLQVAYRSHQMGQ
jgi:adenylate kinase